MDKQLQNEALRLIVETCKKEGGVTDIEIEFISKTLVDMGVTPVEAKAIWNLAKPYLVTEDDYDDPDNSYEFVDDDDDQDDSDAFVDDYELE